MRWYLKLWAYDADLICMLLKLSLSLLLCVCVPGGPVERGGCEEEASSPPGEHIKPCELLQQNMDGKILHHHENPQCFVFSIFNLLLR